MRHRKLRIAWSVAWGVIALLICALWSRSYMWCDYVVIGSRYHFVNSMYGRLQIPGANGFTVYALKPVMKRHSAIGGRIQVASLDIVVLPPDQFVLTSSGSHVNIPHAVLVILTVGIAAMPWLTRFSLRTLLIATTLVAVVLGLIVWLYK